MLAKTTKTAQDYGQGWLLLLRESVQRRAEDMVGKWEQLEPQNSTVLILSAYTAFKS